MIFHQPNQKQKSRQKFKAGKASNYRKVMQYGYSEDDLIGKGKYSHVYKGVFLKTNDSVAIKVIPLSETKSSTSKKYIYSEISILKNLDHPNIVKYYDAFEFEKKWFLITQFCEEGNLATKLGKTALYNQIQNKIIINQIFQGLLYLDHRHIIHRDIKLSNVVIKKGVAKIVDFGFATVSSNLFKDIKIGSPLYMSPQAYINHLYGPKTDVWSFGVMIYQMIYKKSPFKHCQSEEQLATSINQQISHTVFTPQCSTQLQQIILKCLTVRLENRPCFEQLSRLDYFVSDNKQKIEDQFTIPLKIQLETQNAKRVGNKKESVSSTTSFASEKNEDIDLHQNDLRQKVSCQRDISFQINTSIHLGKKQISSPQLLFHEAKLTQVEYIFFINYIRLIYKCCILMRHYRFREQPQLNILKKWILFVLNGLEYHLNYSPANKDILNSSKTAKILFVVQEYILRYQKEFFQKDGSKPVIEQNQLTFSRMTSYFQQIVSRLIFRIRQGNSEQKFVILAHNILVASFMTNLVRQGYESRLFNLGNTPNELAVFLKLKDNQMNTDSLYQLAQRYNFKIK